MCCTYVAIYFHNKQNSVCLCQSAILDAQAVLPVLGEPGEEGMNVHSKVCVQVASHY